MWSEHRGTDMVRAVGEHTQDHHHESLIVFPYSIFELNTCS